MIRKAFQKAGLVEEVTQETQEVEDENEDEEEEVEDIFAYPLVNSSYHQQNFKKHVSRGRSKRTRSGRGSVLR